jgi:NAD(P)H dehydrogenase (quinone)
VGTPKWCYCLINGNAGHNAMKMGVIEFCGIKPVKITVFSGIKSSDEAKKNGWKKLKN